MLRLHRLLLGLALGGCASHTPAPFVAARAPASTGAAPNCTQVALEFFQDTGSQEPLSKLFEDALSQSPHKSSKRSLMRLAAWMDGAPLHKGESFDLIEDSVAALEGLDSSKKIQIADNLLQRYSRFSKDPSETMPQKRVADIMLNLLQNPASSIEREIATGRTAQEAYFRVMDPRRNALKNQSGYGDYSTDRVIEFSKQIQTLLRQNHPDLKLTIGGSLPNLLAHNKNSDLDILGEVTHLSQDELIRLKAQIQEMAKATFGRQNSFHVEEITPENYGNYFRIANSVFIEVSDSEITLITNPAGLRYIEGPPYLENPNASSRYILD